MEQFPITDATIEEAKLIRDDCDAVSDAIDGCVAVLSSIESESGADYVAQFCRLRGRISSLKETLAFILNQYEVSVS